MEGTTVRCPLCFQSSFPSITSLCLNLISVTTRLLECPICHDTLFGLDKFTIHLFSHTFNQPSLIGLQPTTNVSCVEGEQERLGNISSFSGSNGANVVANTRLCNKNVREPFVDNDNKGIVNASCIKTSIIRDGVRKPINNFVKHCESIGKEPYEKSTSTSLMDSKRCDPEIQEVAKASAGNVYTSELDEQDSSRCDNLKKNLEPFLKYPDKSVKSSNIKKKLNVKDFGGTYQSSVDISKNLRERLLSVEALSRNDDDEYCCDNSDMNSCSKISTYCLSSKDVTEKLPSNITFQEFPDDTDNNYYTFNNRIPCSSVNKIRNLIADSNARNLNVNGRGNSSNETNGKIFSNNNCNKVSSDNFYHKITLLEPVGCKTANVSTNTVISDMSSPKVYNDDRLHCDFNITTQNILPLKAPKEMASQAIQTIEESFTKTNKIIPNRINNAGIKFISDKNFEKPGSVCNQSDDLIVDCVTPSGNNLTTDRIVNQSNNVMVSSNCDAECMYCCEICSFKFPDEHILGMHKQLVHSNDAKNFTDKKKSFGCHLCTKSFKMRGSLMVHRRVAHPSGSGN